MHQLSLDVGVVLGHSGLSVRPYQQRGCMISLAVLPFYTYCDGQPISSLT